MTYPRAIALSQALWCANKPNFETFFNILSNTHLSTLNDLNVNYSKTSLKPVIQITSEKKGIGIELQSKDENEQFETLVHSKNCKSPIKFTLSANQILLIERSKNRCIENRFEFESINTGIKSKLDIINHLGLGCPINYKTFPND